MSNGLLKHLKDQKKLKLKGNLYHKTQIALAYNSNRIEGSTLTEEQTRHIYETKQIDGLANVNDIIETTNHFRAFDYMLDVADAPLTEEIIKRFHELLKTGSEDAHIEWFNVGDYKKLPNEVGTVETSSPDMVAVHMKSLLVDYHAKTATTIEDIIEFHWRFESIHPFQDGNGRVGRLIMFKECLKHDIMPFIIFDHNKLFYYRGLSAFPEERGYLVDTCLMAQDIYTSWYIKLIGDFI